MVDASKEDNLSYSARIIFPGSTKLGKAHQTLSSSELFRQGQTHILSALLVAATSWLNDESHLIHGLLESILLDQGFPVEYELDEFNTPHTGTTLSLLQLWLCWLRRKIPLWHPATSSLGNIFWRHASLPQQPGSHIHWWLHHSCL